MHLRRVDAANHVLAGRARVRQRPHVRLRHVVDEAERPSAIRADESRQAAGQMIAKQPSHEVAFGLRARPVDDAGVERDDRETVRGRPSRDVARDDFRALVVIRRQRLRTVVRRQREERRRELEALAGEQREVAWGSQIRSYVLAPYQLVKDVRTEHETGNVQAVLDGDLDQFMEAWLRWRRAAQ